MTLFFSVASGVEVYAGRAATVAYVSDMLGAGAVAFLAMTGGDQDKTLVAVTRYIDSKPWIGVADAAGGTSLLLPRTGILDANGVQMSDAAQLAIVAKAVGEMCALVAAKPAILTATDTSANVRRADAGGGAGVEFFNPTSVALGTATVLPGPVNAYLGAWLATSSRNDGGDGEAGGSVSDFAACRRYDKTGPF